MVTQLTETELEDKYLLPILAARIPAGFPSPADDYLEQKINLNEYIVTHPSATFYYWVEGNSMIEAGIFDGDLIVVDNSIKPKNNDVVLGVINGEITLKQIKMMDEKIFLAPKNPDYKPIEITEQMSFTVRGVIVCNIHFHKKPR